MWGNNFTFQVCWLSRDIPNSEDLAINEAKGNTDLLKGVHFFPAQMKETMESGDQSFKVI